MSKIFDFQGDEFQLRSVLYSSPKESNHFLSFGNHVDVYFPLRKKSRISAPFILTEQNIKAPRDVSFDLLPDELLQEVFRGLPAAERSSCACVSKRWLTLMTDICSNGLVNQDATQSSDESLLSRSLEGKKATDIRLAAIAVGTSAHGGLGKLSIHGSDSSCKVTNIGLRAIAHGCPSLKVLSLWNLPEINDDGLLEIAKNCHLLEKLDICQCDGITGIGLAAIAKNCPYLTDLMIESCPKVGNESLLSAAPHCANLKSFSVKDCPLIGDQGVTSLVFSSSLALSKLKLQSVYVSDVSLAVVGHYGKAITELTLSNLTNVSERGFWAMGNAQGLQILKTLSITSCRGFTDVGIQATGKGFPNLKSFSLRKCGLISDSGVMSFTKDSLSLESLHMEECHRITHYGVFNSLINCADKVKSFSLVNCLGIQDLNPALPMLSPCLSLKSLSIHNCPGFGDKTLSFLGKLCPNLRSIELVDLGVTEAGLLPVLQNCTSGLLKACFNGCVNLSSAAVVKLTELHGDTLQVLSLDNCRMVTDDSLVAVAKNCKSLSELDISRCSVTDSGIASLASSNDLNLQILSAASCVISNKSIPCFLMLGKTLIGLNLQLCNAISSGNINLLMNLLYKCDIIA